MRHSFSNTTLHLTESSAAFERAIESGRLSRDPKAPNFAGHYMFMGPARNGGDAFKHRDTREYIA